MSHVDEGALHAYLDGALDALPAPQAAAIREHLSSCAACSARLEEERAVRAEAQAILAQGTPHAGVGLSLEELRARAAAPEPVGPFARLRRLAWAASIVVALGAGWMLRGARAPVLERAVPAAVEATDPVVDGVDAEAPQRAAATALESLAGPSGAGAGAGETARQASVPAATPASDPERGVAFRASSGAESLDRVAGAVEPGDTFSRTGGLAALEDSLLVRLGDAKVAAGRERVGERAVEPIVAPPAASAARLRVPEEVPRRRADVVPAAALEARPTALGVEQRREADEGAFPGVPGLPFVRAAEDAGGLSDGAVRVLQLLEGDTLEVIHVPHSEPPPELPRPEGDTRTEVVLPRGDGWLVGRAHLPRERLVALLSRIPAG